MKLPMKPENQIHSLMKAGEQEMRIFLFVLISIFLFPITLFAQVQMVTRPERQNVELTIYSSRI